MACLQTACFLFMAHNRDYTVAVNLYNIMFQLTEQIMRGAVSLKHLLMFMKYTLKFLCLKPVSVKVISLQTLC